MLQSIALIVAGLAAGVASGFLGIGGGVILVPALVYLFGYPQHVAQGTTLATLVLPVGLLAAWNYQRSGDVRIGAAVLIAVGFAVGALIGSKYALALSGTTLKRVFGVLMLLLAAKMIFSD